MITQFTDIYIFDVINSFIAYWGASYIRCLRVLSVDLDCLEQYNSVKFQSKYKSFFFFQENKFENVFLQFCFELNVLVMLVTARFTWLMMSFPSVSYEERLGEARLGMDE